MHMNCVSFVSCLCTAVTTVACLSAAQLEVTQHKKKRHSCPMSFQQPWHLPSRHCYWRLIGDGTKPHQTVPKPTHVLFMEIKCCCGLILWLFERPREKERAYPLCAIPPFRKSPWIVNDVYATATIISCVITLFLSLFLHWCSLRSFGQSWKFWSRNAASDTRAPIVSNKRGTERVTKIWTAGSLGHATPQIVVDFISFVWCK